MSLEGKKVTYAKMHAGIHTPQSGQLKDTLTAVGDPSNAPVKMVIEGGFVKVTAKNASTKREVDILVPLTNFTHLVLADQ
jgi:hypothetical protein